jgi:hypothetical protein
MLSEIKGMKITACYVIDARVVISLRAKNQNIAMRTSHTQNTSNCPNTFYKLSQNMLGHWIYLPRTLF